MRISISHLTPLIYHYMGKFPTYPQSYPHPYFQPLNKGSISKNLDFDRDFLNTILVKLGLYSEYLL